MIPIAKKYRDQETVKKYVHGYLKVTVRKEEIKVYFLKSVTKSAEKQQHIKRFYLQIQNQCTNINSKAIHQLKAIRKYDRFYKDPINHRNKTQDVSREERVKHVYEENYQLNCKS